MLARSAVSGSVAAAARRLEGAVPAAAVAWELFELHPEYGGKSSSTTRLSEGPDSVRRTVDEWLAEVRGLVDESAVPELHGRIVIVGLALLDDDLRGRLEAGGTFSAIVAELREPLEKVLTKEGLSRLGSWVAAASTATTSAAHEASTPSAEPPRALAEAVPTHTDNPATIDALKRGGFAQVLAERIRDMRAKEAAAGDREFPRGRSFLIHLHGPWGSGKTSLLNFLAEELRQPPAGEQRWVVVSFNAWQHQRIVPPWWWLMETLYRDALRELWRIDKRRWLRLRGREWLWRLGGSWPGIAMVVVGIAALAVTFELGWWHAVRHVGGKSATSWTWLLALLGAIAAGLSSLLTIVGAVRGAGRWAFTGSARSARAYIDAASDPMTTAKEHFCRLVDWIDYSVAFFIDDLDRCKPDYVVQLLEGLQTLFRDVPVAYVVAADREWLADCYNHEYATFNSAIAEPGRPLGYLFLEKTFQMTATVPAIPPDVRLGFWADLIHPARAAVDPGKLARAREAARAEFQGAASDAEVHDRLQAHEATTVEEHQARLEAAAVRLASADVAAASEHVLRPFSLLLDHNPRAMKRLVNAYGVARGVEVLYGQNADGGREAQQQTALWTILNLRWPRLGEFLADHPDRVHLILNGTNGSPLPPDVPADIAPLFRDEGVRAIVRGEAEGVVVQLDAAAIRFR